MQTPSDYLKVALNAKAPQQIASYGQKACDLAVSRKQFVEASSYHFELGSRLYEEQHYLLGIQQIQQGLATANRYGVQSDTLLFKCRSLLASMYARLTINDSAAYWYSQAEKMLVSKSHLVQLIPDYVDAHYYNQGFFYVRLGDQERAISSIRKSVDMAEEKGDPRSIALSYQQLANSYFLSYQYEEAAVYYRKALAGFNYRSVDMCWGYAFLGNCLRAGGKLDEGLRWLRLSQQNYRAILSLNPSKQDTNFDIEGNYYLGKCEQLAGLDKAATKSFQRSIQAHQQFRGRRGELIAAAWTGLAAIALKQNKLTEALSQNQQGLIAATVLFSQSAVLQNPEADDIKSGKPLYEALRLKGAIWHQLYRKTADHKALKQAIQSYRLGLRVAQRIRRSFAQVESTHFFNEQIQPCVSDALDAVFDLHAPARTEQQTALVFDLLQYYQSMGMADALYNKALKRELIPARLRQQERDLQQKMINAGAQLFDTMTTSDRQTAIRRVEDIKRQLYLFEDALAYQHPRYYALKYSSQPMRIDEVQAKMAPQTAYLSYFLSQQYIYGFIATKTEATIFRRPITPSFARSVIDLRKTVETNPGMFDYEGQAAANQVYAHLIAPIEPYIRSVKRLIVERNDILTSIPFDVLEPQAYPRAYLCKRLAISYSYSAKLTFTTRTDRAVMKPVGFAPYSDDLLWREKAIPDSQLLPKSAEEVRESGGGKYVNAQATKAHFLRAIPTANILHLATHAIADDERPEASAIGFYPGRPDSLLHALEIVTFPLDHVRLVILSACKGNGGRLRKAEGVMSLTRAFRLAGCPTILTTNWNAHNETTRELIGRFYVHLRRGLPADLAMQQARLDYFTSPSFSRWGHPYYWANLTLIGNPDVAFQPVHSWHVGLLIAGVVLAVAGAWLFRYRTAKPTA